MALPDVLVRTAILPLQNTTGWVTRKTEIYFTTVLEALSTRSGHQHGWFLELFSWLAEGHLLSLHLTWLFLNECASGQREGGLWYFFFQGHQPYSIRTLNLWSHLTLITSLEVPSLNIATLDVRVSTYECEWAQIFGP